MFARQLKTVDDYGAEREGERTRKTLVRATTKKIREKKNHPKDCHHDTAVTQTLKPGRSAVVKHGKQQLPPLLGLEGCLVSGTHAP